MASMSDSREQLSTDSIPPLPPPMPSLSQLVHQMRKSGHCKGSFDEASNSMCIVELPLSTSTHEGFDESSVHMTGVTSSTPVSEGGFYASFFPEVPLCLLPSPIQLEQPPKLPPTSTKPPPMSAKLPSTSTKLRTKKNEEAKKMMFLRRQNKLKECQDNSPIDADAYQPKNPAREEQPWLPTLGLSERDRRTLISPTAWLTDVIINSAQKLLKTQNSSFVRVSECWLWSHHELRCRN